MKRDPEARKAQILTAAANVFAREGYGGGRVDAIAEQALVNKRMLYHYFGDKAGLFDAVIADQLPVLCSFIRGEASQEVRPQQLERLWRLLAWDALRPSPAASVQSLRASLAEVQPSASEREAVLLRLAYSVLQQLLPVIAGHLGGTAGEPGEQPKALETVSQAPKPRVKLAPAITRSGADQAASER